MTGSGAGTNHLEPFERRLEWCDRRLVLAGDQLDETREEVGLQQRRDEGRAPRVSHWTELSIDREMSNRPRRASSTAWQRIDVASTDGAAVVIRNKRITSRQRPPARGTGLGPHKAANGAAPSAALTRRRSPDARAATNARSSSASASPTRPNPANNPRTHLTRLGLARAVTQRGERNRGRGRRSFSLHEPVGVGQADQLRHRSKPPMLTNGRHLMRSNAVRRRGREPPWTSPASSRLSLANSNRGPRLGASLSRQHAPMPAAPARQPTTRRRGRSARRQR